MHSNFSSRSPVQEPPVLSGIATFLNLLLTPGPHLAEQEVQSDHSDQRHFGEIVAGDTVVTELFLSSPDCVLMQVLLSDRFNVKFFGQVQM